MKTHRLEVGEAVVEITVVDDIIYAKGLNLIDDATAIALINYIRSILDETSHTVRVYDASSISSDRFVLSSKLIGELAFRARQMNANAPECSNIYFIAPEPLIFGLARMLEMQAANESVIYHVVNSIDDLPEVIRSKLPV